MLTCNLHCNARAQVVGYTPPEDANRVNVEVSHDEAGPVPVNVRVKLFLQPLKATEGVCAQVRHPPAPPSRVSAACVPGCTY